MPAPWPRAAGEGSARSCGSMHQSTRKRGVLAGEEDGVTACSSSNCVGSDCEVVISGMK